LSVIVALTVSGRHIHYEAMRLLNAHLTQKNLKFAEQVAKAEAVAERLRPLEQELQRALARTRRAARTGTGTGGPNPRQAHGIEAGLLPEEIPRRVSQLIDASGELFKKYEGLASLAAATPSGWSVRGWVTSEFGERISPYTGEVGTNHEGIDIACKRGTPIVATADGMVIRSGWNQGGYGKMVEIIHGYGYTTRYGHCSRLAVSAGQSVRKGDTIGYAGATGNATGPHLHYEIRLYGVGVNPRLFMK
jgi:murein DD-endopeptidase MepM/ murein hydrolase activator NlpD